MKGLVTVFGGSGFVGTQIVRALARRGMRIRVAVRQPGRAYRLRMLGDVGQIEVTQANLRDGASVGRALDGAEACVNAVAVLYESGGQTFEALHVEGAERVAAAAAARGVSRFTQISAIGADPQARSAYARTKALGEAAVREAFPAATIVRPSVVFGPDDHFFNRFAQMAQISPVLPLIGGGHTRMQPVFVADVGAAVAETLLSDRASGRTFELGGPEVFTFRALMELMLEVIQRRRILLPVPLALARLIGAAGDLSASVGLPPPLTTDQVALLQADNVVAPGAPGLVELGVRPSAVETNIPSYLYRYRRGGQYAGRAEGFASQPPV
ncbi:MAG TPA: complex I NDUFA9 subunit family protein [Caulobacteraceae bacterium]|jgi:NADH dehydrogenase|nr:complex I NDUFA9 subunit family protein [Caulobacteraceae bacterium]